MKTLTKTPETKTAWYEDVWMATKDTAEYMYDYAVEQPFNTILAIGTGLALTQKAFLLAATMTALAVFNTVVNTILKGAISDSSMYALKQVWKQSNRPAKEALIKDYILKPRGVGDVTQEEMDTMVTIMDQTFSSV